MNEVWDEIDFLYVDKHQRLSWVQLLVFLVVSWLITVLFVYKCLYILCVYKFICFIVRYILCRRVFRTLPNIYGGAFCKNFKKKVKKV